MPPTPANVAACEKWLCSKDQATTYFSSKLSTQSSDTADIDCGLVMVVLKEQQTFLLPSGWIHAVYTSQDSIVFGGNFLHGLDIHRQIQIDFALEVRAGVLKRFRFPLFRELHFAATSMYLQKLRRGEALAELEKEGIPVLMETLEEWWKGYQHEEKRWRRLSMPITARDQQRSRPLQYKRPDRISVERWSSSWRFSRPNTHAWSKRGVVRVSWCHHRCRRREVALKVARAPSVPCLQGQPQEI